MKTIICPLILLLFLVFTASGQPAASPGSTNLSHPTQVPSTNAQHLQWLNISGGFGSFSNVNGSSLLGGLGASYNYSLKKHFLLSGRASFANEITIFGGGDVAGFWDAGVIPAVFTSGRVGMASIGIGLGVSGGNFYDSANSELEKTFTTIGFPAEAQLFLHGGKVGIGLVIQGNINTQKSSLLTMLTLQFGQLRWLEDEPMRSPPIQ